MKVIGISGFIVGIIGIVLAIVFYVQQKDQSNKTNELLEKIENQEKIMKEKDEILGSFLKTLIEHDALALYINLDALTKTYTKFNKEYPHIKERINGLARDAQGLHDKLDVFARKHYGYKPEE